MRKHPCGKSTIIHAEAPLREIHHARPAAAQPVCGHGKQLHPAVGPSRLECLGVLEYPWVVLPVHPDVCAVDDDIPRPVLQARPIRAHHAYPPGLTSAAVDRIGAQADESSRGAEKQTNQPRPVAGGRAVPAQTRAIVCDRPPRRPTRRRAGTRPSRALRSSARAASPPRGSAQTPVSSGRCQRR